MNFIRIEKNMENIKHPTFVPNFYLLYEEKWNFHFLKNTRRTKKKNDCFKHFFLYFFLKKSKEGKSWAQSWSLSSLEKYMEKLIIFYYISINFDSVLEIVFARLYSRKW
jgi:hypothetical protein